MLALLFNQRAIPRSTMRSEWREIDRWRRKTQREIDRLTMNGREAMQNFGAFGHTEMHIQLAERMINPPVLVFPSF